MAGWGSEGAGVLFLSLTAEYAELLRRVVNLIRMLTKRSDRLHER